MTQYPGSDPDDPFSQPPNESGTPAEQPATPPTPPSPPPTTPADQPAGTEETAPIQREEMGYWEKKALEDQARLQQEANQAPPADQPSAPPAAPTYQAPPPPQDPLQAYGAGSTGGYQPPPQQQPYGQPPDGQPPSGQSTYGGQPPYGQSTYGGQPPYGGQYGQPAYGGGYQGYQVQNHPQAVTALVLGLVGLIGGCLCAVPLLVSPFAWAVGARAKREIAASHGQLGGEGNANAGFILGIIGTVLLVLAVVGLVLLFAIGFATDSGSSTSYSDF